MSWKAGPIYPCNPATARGKTTKLAVDPKGEKIVYANGRAVIIRDLSHVGLSHAYTQHTQTVTVARISPSGYYAASGDVAGNVRIWDVTQPENNLKLATRPLANINDLAWDGESKRIVVGGDGRDKFGAAFLFDSGSSVGEISGHAKAINAVSIRHQRPFRAVTASDDNDVGFHNGVPFKYNKKLSHHSRFVQDVAYSPNGELFASVGTDGAVYFFDGKEGDLKGSAEGGEGGGSMMACSWDQDSTQLATAAASGIVTIWDASTFKPVQTYHMGSDVGQQQNGVVWASAGTVVSVSLNGVLNLLDPRDGDVKNARHLYGPVVPITASALAGEGKERTFYAGSGDGAVKAYDFSGNKEQEGACSEAKGTGHSGRVSSISEDGKGKVYTAGWDDKVSQIENGAFTSSTIPTKNQPSSVAATPNGVYISTSAGIIVRPSGGKETLVKGDASLAVAASSGPNGDVIAYGSGQKSVILASVSGESVKEEKKFEDNRGEVVSLAFSHDGKLLAAGDSTGRITLFDVAELKALVTSRWTFHSGRVTALAFSPDGKRLASGGLDESIYIFTPGAVSKTSSVKNTHPGGVTGLSWLESNRLVTAGADAIVRTWTVPE